MYQREIISLVSLAPLRCAFAKKYSSTVVRHPAANRTIIIRPSNLVNVI